MAHDAQSILTRHRSMSDMDCDILAFHAGQLTLAQAAELGIVLALMGATDLLDKATYEAITGTTVESRL